MLNLMRSYCCCRVDCTVLPLAAPLKSHPIELINKQQRLQEILEKSATLQGDANLLGN